MGLTALDTKARLLDPLEELRKNSLDYYAAIRSVYTQFRRAQISDKASSDVMASGAAATGTVDMPDYDDFEMADYE